MLCKYKHVNHECECDGWQRFILVIADCEQDHQDFNLGC